MKTIQQLLSKYPEETTNLAIATRSLLLKELPAVIEMPDDTANIIGYGYSNKYIDIICTIILSKKGIKLGFNKGAELPDPKKLLIGSGKVHKYADIKTMADIKNPAIKNLLHVAQNAWKLRSKK